MQLPVPVPLDDTLFTPTEEHRMLREMVADFVLAEVEPGAAARDESGRLDLPLFRRLGELGLLGITVPPESGGAGMDATAAVIAHHELSKSDPGLCLAYLAHALLFANNLANCGDEALRRRYLPKVASGEWVAGLAMTEPGHGTDVLGMTTTAVRDGGCYVLNGVKTFITNGPDGFCFLVYAKVDGRVTAFVVDRDCPGFSSGPRTEKMGMRAAPMSELFFEDCRVPAAQLIGREGGGLLHMMRNLEMERLGLAAMSLGIADRCLSIMVRHARERQAFGQPIHRFGQVQRHIGESFALAEAVRCLVYQVARNVSPSVRNRIGSDAAKLLAAPAGKRVADAAMQVLGGSGYCREFPVERLYRDAKLLEIGGGTVESHQKNLTADLVALLG